MCIHELSECAWCPSPDTYARRAQALSALMERPAPVHVHPLQATATIVPAPSTDTFGRYEPGYESSSLAYTKAIPTLGYNHWAVTSEIVAQDLPMIKCYETSIYGETTFVGLKRPY